MSTIESLKWRTAIKKFDPTKKVSNEDLDKLIEAANLAPTSGGFQPFKLIVISNQETKDKLIPASYGQRQVADSSHILVFAIKTDIDETLVDDYISRAANIRNQSVESMQGYRD